MLDKEKVLATWSFLPSATVYDSTVLKTNFVFEQSHHKSLQTFAKKLLICVDNIFFIYQFNPVGLNNFLKAKLPHRIYGLVCDSKHVNPRLWGWGVELEEDYLRLWDLSGSIPTLEDLEVFKNKNIKIYSFCLIFTLNELWLLFVLLWTFVNDCYITRYKQ